MKTFNHAFRISLCLVFICVIHSSFAIVIHVPADYPTIQAAIDAATDGDEVIVAPGTYYENLTIGGKNITLRSTDPINPSVVDSTVIDGNFSGSVVIFAGTENETCVLSGFTITNGLASQGGGINGNTTLATIEFNTISDNAVYGGPHSGLGGGIYQCNGTVQNNTIARNLAFWGGGLHSCNGTLQNNLIARNSAYDDGAGLHSCLGTVQSNTISLNSAHTGGGLSDCHGTIFNNTISGNSAMNGGGLHSCNGTVESNTILGNLAEYGGGLYDCDAAILHNTITGNWADNGGGGLRYCHGSIGHNTIADNSAGWHGGGCSECGGTIQFNTIMANWGGASAGGLHSCNGTVQYNTITGNYSVNWGGGLSYCYGTVQHNTITANSAITGGGLKGCGGIVQHNTISDNLAYDNGGGLGWCEGIIQHNTISNNTSWNDGAGLWECDADIQHNIITGNWADDAAGLGACHGTIQNNIIYHNSAGDKGGGFLWCNGLIQNNTIYGNTVGGEGGGIFDCDGPIRNCIIWQNTATQGSQLYDSGTPSYSCIQDWTGGGTGNIASDPQFVDPANADFQLQDGSPCIDAGHHDTPFNDACLPPGKGTGRNDMGAYGGPHNCGWLIISIQHFNFEGTTHNWQFETPSPSSAELEHWASATAITTDPNAIGISSPADESTNYFAYWHSLDAADIPYYDNTLYQVDFSLSTDRDSPNSCPSVRLRIGLDNQKAFSYSRLYPGDWLSLSQRPGSTEFQLFFDPPIPSDSLFLAFSLIDWTDDFRLSSPYGTIYLEEVTVYRRDLAGFTQWAEVSSLSGSDFVSWTESSATGYDPPIHTREADDSLSLSSGIGADHVFGSWDSPTTLFTFEPDKLYRLTTHLSSNPQLGGPDLRLRVHTDDFRYSWYTYYLSSYTQGESALPPEAGADYGLYLTLPFSTQPCHMSFDLIDFSTSFGGTLTLHSLSLHSHPF